MSFSLKKQKTIKQKEKIKQRTESSFGGSSVYSKNKTKDAADQAKLNDLNRYLRKFQDDHGVTFTCNTVYTHTATTLKEDNSMIVLFQNQVASGQQLVDYKTYRQHPDLDIKQMPQVRVQEPGPFFNLVATTGMFGESKHMTSKECRQVHYTYQNCRPVFSSNQDLICLQREKSRLGAGLIDVFRCDEIDQGFFKSKRKGEMLSCESHEYCFSVYGENDCEIQFSKNDHFMAVYSGSTLRIYELQHELLKKSQAQSLRGSSSSGKKHQVISRVSINEIEEEEDADELEHQRQMQFKEQSSKSFNSNILSAKFEFILTNETYSRIVNFYLSEERDAQEMASKSWVVLESEQFKTLHFILLCDIIPKSLLKQDDRRSSLQQSENQEHSSRLINVKEESKSRRQQFKKSAKTVEFKVDQMEQSAQAESDFGMNFFRHSSGGRLIRLDDAEMANYSHISVTFQHNGKIALIQTDEQIFELNLVKQSEDSQGNNHFLSVKKIPITDPSGIQLFNLGMDDLIFCKRDPQQTSIALTMHNTKDPNVFSETQFEVSGDIEIVEIVESNTAISTRNRYLRMIGIRDKEEVLCWEIRTTCHGPKTLKVFNRSDRAAFRFPFYAYAMSDHEIVINYLSEQKVGIYYKMEFEYQEDDHCYIHKLCFSNSCELYVITRERDRRVAIYRIDVGKDLSIENRQGLSSESHQDLGSFIEIPEAPSQVLQRVRKSDSEFVSHFQVKLEQERIAVPLYETRLDIEEVFAIEHRESVQMKTALLIYGQHKLTLINIHANKELQSQFGSKNEAQKIIRLTEDTFVTMDVLGHKLNRIAIKYQGNSFKMHETIIYQDFNAKIINVIGELGKLYIMVDDRQEIKIKVLSFSEKNMTNLSIQACVGEDKNISQDEEFKQAFAQAKFICTGCLIINDWRLSKVSQIDDDSVAIFQNYFNFIHDEPDQNDRNLLIEQSKISLKHRRIALVFNYPDSGSPKKVQIQPFLDDNRISLSQKQGQATWIAETDNSCKDSKEGEKRILQLLPQRWKLFEYNMTGLLTKVTSYDDEMSQFNVLARSNKEPTFLVSEFGPDYINVLQLRKITGADQTKLIDKINLKQVFVYRRTGWLIKHNSKQTQSVYDEIQSWRSQPYLCTQEFKINSKGDIAIASVLPSGYIVSIIILAKFNNDSHRPEDIMETDDSQQECVSSLQYRAVEVKVRDNEPAEQPSHLKTQQNQARMEDQVICNSQQPFLQHTHQHENQWQDEQELRVKKFRFTKKFSISDKKLLMWNKRTILQGDIGKIQEKCEVYVNKILLEIAKLSDCLSVHRQDKKLKQMRQSQQMQQSLLATKELHERHDQIKDTDDYFELIECHDVEISQNREKCLSTTTMQVKIITRGNKSHIMSYDLDRDREVTWVGAEKNSKIFYGSGGQCFVQDEKLGILNLHTKELMLEFHALDKNKNSLAIDKVDFGISWGHRIIRYSEEKSLMIFANHLLLPFSYFNIIQWFRSNNKDRERQIFFVEDYCKILGANNLHKCKYDPAMTEKILDCYWQQNSIYAASVLVKQEFHKDGPNMQTIYRRLNESKQKLSSSLQKSKRKSVLDQFQLTENQLTLLQSDKHIVYTQDIMETQIEISSYRLIDKILLFLSQLPAQISFYQLYPRFKDLTKFKYFSNYMDIWLQSTSQTVNTQVLFTSMKQGKHHELNESSYLDKDFFEKYPVQNYAKEQLPDYQTCKKFKNSQMQQVNIKMIQVSWLKDSKKAKAFFNGLVESQNLELFKNPNMIEIIKYMWNTCAGYFIWRRFVPFVLMLYTPITLFTFLPHTTDNKFDHGVQLTCLALSCMYMLYQGYGMLQDICKLGLTNYLTTFNSLIELVIFVLMIGFLAFAEQKTIDIWKYEFDEDQEGFLCCLEIAIVLILNLQLFRFLKIFKFFQSFIRQLIEIIKSTAQIASMLLFVIITQALLLYILDENSFEPQYRHKGIKGFIKSIIDSYALAVGDFEPVQNAFIGNTDYAWLFWLIFFFGTLMSLILLLNMVIAVMSMALEEVVNESEALVNREKLIDMLTNIHKLPMRYKRQLSENKYLIVIEVDPEYEQNLDAKDKKSEAYILQKDNSLTSSSEERQQVKMQAQLEFFQSQILAMMHEKGKKEIDSNNQFASNTEKSRSRSPPAFMKERLSQGRIIQMGSMSGTTSQRQQ